MNAVAPAVHAVARTARFDQCRFVERACSVIASVLVVVDIDDDLMPSWPSPASSSPETGDAEISELEGTNRATWAAAVAA